MVKYLILLIFTTFLTIQAVPMDTDCDPKDPENCRCPHWGPWENVTCYWPSKSYDSLPKSCTKIPFPPKVPEVIKQLFESEIRDAFSMISEEYNLRGKPSLCGHCAMSFRCRVRQNKSEDEASLGDDYDGGRRRHEFCKPKQIQPIKANCSDSRPCQIKKVFGGCPVPFFLRRGHSRRSRGNMENVDYEKMINELSQVFQQNEDLETIREKRVAVEENQEADLQDVTKNFGDRRRVWINRRWRPWLRHRYQSGRPGMYPSDRVGSYGSITNPPDFTTPSKNAMFMRRPEHHRRGGHGRHGPSPKWLIIHWLFHGTKCISSDNACLCCCSHFIPNAKNKTCDDIFKLYPHLAKLAETYQEEPNEYDKLPILNMIPDKFPYASDPYNAFDKLDKNTDDF